MHIAVDTATSLAHQNLLNISKCKSDLDSANGKKVKIVNIFLLYFIVRYIFFLNW